MVYGEVTSTKPLKVRTDQKMELGEEQLRLTNAVRDYKIALTPVGGDNEGDDVGYHLTENETEHTHMVNLGNAGGPVVGPTNPTQHQHKYTDKKVFKVHLGLKVGEKVILQQVQGGQTYIILDRVDPPDGTEGSEE